MVSFRNHQIRGLVGLTVPTVSLSRITERFPGYEIPLIDTLSDPLDVMLILVVLFIDMFKPGSDVLEKGVKLAVVVEFTELLSVRAIQPAANINPREINSAIGTITFIYGTVTRD
jgi:hypothetical protein